MKTLEDLKIIASAATPSVFESSDPDDHLFIDGPTEYYSYEMPKILRDYIATFNPELVSALLDELVAGRAFQYHHYSEPSIFADEFYQARERTEAVLRGKP